MSAAQHCTQVPIHGDSTQENQCFKYRRDEISKLGTKKGQKMRGQAGCAHGAAATQAEPQVLQPFRNMNAIGHMALLHCRVSRQDGPSRNPKAGQDLLAVLLLLSPNKTQHSSRNGSRAAAAAGERCRERSRKLFISLTGKKKAFHLL